MLCVSLSYVIMIHYSVLRLFLWSKCNDKFGG